MEDKEFSSINVIPLVDIMLVLLTIVLITATFVVQGSIPVKLPQSKSSDQGTIQSYNIALSKEGLIMFEGKIVSLEDLEKILGNISREANISLYADKDARVQVLVDTLDLLKKLKFQKVFIRTQVVR